jgi:hypothetical protein
MDRPESVSRITVFVNDTPVAIYAGMQVQHALVSYNASLFQACQRGELRVEDEHGFRVGLEGGLREGSRIYTKGTGSPCMPEHAGAGRVEGRGSKKKNHT